MRPCPVHLYSWRQSPPCLCDEPSVQKYIENICSTLQMRCHKNSTCGARHIPERRATEWRDPTTNHIDDVMAQKRQRLPRLTIWWLMSASQLLRCIYGTQHTLSQHIADMSDKSSVGHSCAPCKEAAPCKTVLTVKMVHCCCLAVETERLMTSSVMRICALSL